MSSKDKQKVHKKGCSCKLKGDNKVCFSGDATIGRGSRGPVGPRGPKGCDGEQGSVGPRGHMGFKGEKGSRGKAGPKGPHGPHGPRGPRGFYGPTGPMGMTGPRGFDGPTGPIGPSGTQIICLCVDFTGISGECFTAPPSCNPSDYFLEVDCCNLLQCQSDGVTWLVIDPGIDPFYFLDQNGMVWEVSGESCNIIMGRPGDKILDCCTGDLLEFGVTGGYQYNGCNLKGPTGMTGPMGPTGPQGPTGETGSIWKTKCIDAQGVAQNGPPLVGVTGPTGTLHLDIDHCRLYVYNGSLWTFDTLLTYPYCFYGENDQQIYIANGMDDCLQLVCRDNDQLLDPCDGNVYTFIDGDWILQGNIKGPTGPSTGCTGPIGPTGIQGPTGPQGRPAMIECICINYRGRTGETDADKPLTGAYDGEYFLVREIGGALCQWVEADGNWIVINLPDGFEFFFMDLVTKQIWFDIINGGIPSQPLEDVFLGLQMGDKFIDCITGDLISYGETGLACDCNLKGPTGPTGAMGATGAMGPTGAMGATGAMGPTGPNLISGPENILSMWIETTLGQTGSTDQFFFRGTQATGASDLTGDIDGVTGFAVGNNHLFIHVNDVTFSTGPTGTITISGQAINEDDGVSSSQSEIIEIDGSTGQYYQTHKKWLDINSIIVNSGVSGINYDYGRLGYLDLGNRNFAISGYRAEFRANGNDADVAFVLQKVQDDGNKKVSLVEMEHIQVDDINIVDTARSGTRNYTSSVNLWPDETAFVFKQTDFDTYFSSDENIIEGETKHEGMIIKLVNDGPDGPDYARINIQYYYP